MDALRVVSLLAATVSMGLVAGVFSLGAHTVMPGLGKTDDRTAVRRAIWGRYLPWVCGDAAGGAAGCGLGMERRRSRTRGG